MASELTRNSEDLEGLYERDYYSWALDQARALRERQAAALDWENLAEEVEGLARSEARSLRSQMARLITHLLKWQFQGSRRASSERSANSWRASVGEARQEISDLLDDNPGLKPRVAELLPKAHSAALRRASRETGFVESRFPALCPWTFEQIMDADFWPKNSPERQ